MNVCELLQARRCGRLPPEIVQGKARALRTARLDLNVDVELKSPHHRGCINWLDIDTRENRYLLSASGDGTIALFDLDSKGASDDQNGRGVSSDPAVKVIERLQHAPRMRPSAHRTPEAALQGHCFSVNAVHWYPVDTGIFVSAGADGDVKVWDTNTFSVATEFLFDGKAFACALPQLPTDCNNLIAVGLDSPAIRLCDLNSGGNTHSLPGHTECVWCVEWSPADAYMLASSSADGTVRLWDVRRSGASACLHSFDREYTRKEDNIPGVFNNNDGNGGNNGSGAEISGPGLQAVHGSFRRQHMYGSHVSAVNALARAHGGGVTGLTFAPGGDYLLSSGSDNRLLLWEVHTGYNTLTHYLKTRNSRRRSFQMAVADIGPTRMAPTSSAPLGGPAIFYPDGGPTGEVLVYPLHTTDGKAISSLSGHFETAQCCTYRKTTQELVTGGLDGLMLLWTCPTKAYVPPNARKKATDNTDDWSSDEDVIATDGGGAFVPQILRQPQRRRIG